jgi:Protein kinase domain
MGDDGKSTIVDRPSGPEDDDRKRAPTEPPRPSRRSVPPGVRYNVGDEIGRGGMGRVVEATDTLLDRRVAVKEALTTDAELLRRFARETKITARLEHPSIVPVYDAGTRHGQPYYVMRRVSGRPLSELIRDATSLDTRLALVPHVLAAAQAIAHAHQRGIIHRDIKPSNILVGELGETVVIDWGLAKVIGEPDDDGTVEDEPDPNTSLRTKFGAVFGTPGFMAPDQVRGDAAGTQSDVYSLGASLYNLLAAEPPHYASDSTQMMKLAAMGPPKPLADLVAGVPAELSTIVESAMAYDPARRYQDAGAFAEELKRFLAGQLVASHQYSRTERFLRFLRANRAVIAIGGIAFVIVIVVGAFAVSQVVEERDRADAQARLATQGRHEAEAARAMADERADQLLISRARALVETNPTAAVASIKQLSPKSKRIEEARAIVTAARMRGVAWAMPANNGITAYATLDQTGLRVAHTTTDGMLHVYDLDARRTAFDVDVGRGAQPRWILDGKQLLVGGDDRTRLFDAAGKELATTLPHLTYIETDERGLTALAIDNQERAVRIDLVTSTVTPLVDAATDVVVSPDGKYSATITKTEVVVYAANTVLLRRAHAAAISRLVFSSLKVAVIDDDTIFEAKLAAGAAWESRKAYIPNKTFRPYWIDYNNERLFATFTDTRVYAAYENTMHEIGRMEVTSGGMSPFAGDYLIVGGDGRRVYYVDGARMRELYLPISLRFIRMLSRRNLPRIVAIGDGAIAVLDLETLPRRLPIDRYQSTLFMNEQTLVSTNAYAFDYGWFDLPSNKLTKVDTEGPATLVSYDREQGRLLTIESTAAGKRGLVYQTGKATPTEEITVPFDKIQILGAGGLVYASKNRVFGGFTGTTRPELFSTNGDVAIIVRLPGTRFAVVADHELVLGDLKTSAIERIALPEGPIVSYAVGYRDKLVLSRGNKVYRWDKTLEVVAELETDPAFLIPLEHGLLVQLGNHATMMIGNDGVVHRLAATRGVVLASEDRVIVPGQFQYDVVELPSFARWSLPITRTADNANVQLDISPQGTQLTEKAEDGRLWAWKLPVTEDFTTALSATNLYEDPNGLLLWPWQAPVPTK